MNKNKRSLQKTKNELQKQKETVHRVIDEPKLESTPTKSFIDEQGNIKFVTNSEDRKDAFKRITGTKDKEIADNILLSGVRAIDSVITLGANITEKVCTGGNIMLQSLNDFQPKDAVEARLISQATALYQHGMDRLGKAGRSEQIAQSEAQTNMAIKILRCHNETVEALNRYRRGGEQKVTVTHAVLTNQAIINNNFPGGGGSSESRGDKPCSESAVPKPDPTTINHAASPQWPMEGADCTVDYVLVQKQKKVGKG